MSSKTHLPLPVHTEIFISKREHRTKKSGEGNMGREYKGGSGDLQSRNLSPCRDLGFIECLHYWSPAGSPGCRMAADTPSLPQFILTFLSSQSEVHDSMSVCMSPSVRRRWEDWVHHIPPHSCPHQPVKGIHHCLLQLRPDVSTIRTQREADRGTISTLAADVEGGCSPYQLGQRKEGHVRQRKQMGNE